MIITRCPVRISLTGGGSDTDKYLQKFGKGHVVSFTPTLYTYVIINEDYLGKNSLEKKYYVSYSKREEIEDIKELKNDLVKNFLIEYKVPPIGTILTSDVFSHGSGLAVSSSYSCSLSLAYSEMLKKESNTIDILNEAHRIEKITNPKLGLQDIYGVGIGGFKSIKFENNNISYSFIPSDLFVSYDVYLIDTGIRRDSNKVLESYKISTSEIYDMSITAYELLVKQNFDEFFKIMRDSWELKKRFSTKILGNKILVNIDAQLTIDKNCLAYKLCGAGNGGFFLAFYNKNIKPNFQNAKQIHLSNSGLERIL